MTVALFPTLRSFFSLGCSSSLSHRQEQIPLQTYGALFLWCFLLFVILYHKFYLEWSPEGQMPHHWLPLSTLLLGNWSNCKAFLIWFHSFKVYCPVLPVNQCLKIIISCNIIQFSSSDSDRITSGSATLSGKSRWRDFEIIHSNMMITRDIRRMPYNFYAYLPFQVCKLKCLLGASRLTKQTTTKYNLARYKITGCCWIVLQLGSAFLYFQNNLWKTYHALKKSASVPLV